MKDSTKTIQHATYKIIEPKIRVETQIGVIESDSGNHIIDGITVIVLILVLYISKKLIDKYFRSKKWVN